MTAQKLLRRKATRRSPRCAGVDRTSSAKGVLTIVSSTSLPGFVLPTAINPIPVAIKSVAFTAGLMCLGISPGRLALRKARATLRSSVPPAG